MPITPVIVTLAVRAVLTPLQAQQPPTGAWMRSAWLMPRHAADAAPAPAATCAHLRARVARRVIRRQAAVLARCIAAAAPVPAIRVVGRLRARCAALWGAAVGQPVRPDLARLTACKSAGAVCTGCTTGDARVMRNRHNALFSNRIHRLTQLCQCALPQITVNKQSLSVVIDGKIPAVLQSRNTYI